MLKRGLLREKGFNASRKAIRAILWYIFVFLSYYLFIFFQYYQEPKLYTRVLDGFNIGFTAVFLLECILKLIAFKPKVRSMF